MIDETSIVSLEMSDGDPGYFVRGHVDKAAFVAVVNSEYDEEFEPGDAQHIYQTSHQPGRFAGKPEACGEGDNFWWICKPDDEGAFPCTLLAR